ncbi:asparagine synthase (glutamine-hydrolyzing) [Anaeromyxobacter paludicola]|uniref:asparagine synthase (glutamine-hydrolyzing) n=1 Tax=Anaeromyxobacter paludicola TaxID=2918171 RepID=A0ABM7XG48_9BACT|nr:asparagine synthase (glutamine-hydrolyzing) [Anaeromyxobacter paludicola]BDG10852.1 asparagine synthetase B [Anaeromyxobacter paludicola]
MCGIAGEVRLDRSPDAEAVRRMGPALAHRGPDAEGFFFEGPAALAHRRLSILDLEGGGQPMSAGGCTLVFNGQCYRHEALRAELRARGHAFQTRSDTEVVLRAYLEWGEPFVERLDGMFAVALWDSRARKLLLARDRMGKKPLYYALAQGGAFLRAPPAEGLTPATGALFASEPKALLAHGGVPRALDRTALVQYLAVEYVPQPRSVWDAVFKLPAAHVAVLDAQGFRLRRYWELPLEGGAPERLDEAGRGLVERLEGAVARRLVADVPVGVFLSGGVDSTAIAALATRHARPVATFSIGFEEASFDESRWARLAAERLGTDHHEERLSATASLDLLPAAVEELDEPFADPSVLPTLLLSRFVRKHVTVALAGDGGDELFAGYDTFLAHGPAALAARIPAPLLAAASRAAALLPASDRNMSFDFRLKQFLRGVGAEPSLRHQAWIGAFAPGELARVLSPELAALATPEVVFGPVRAAAARDAARGVRPGSVDEALRFFLAHYLEGDILVKADRASMAASLEARAPFLDLEVVEYAARLPASLKLGWRSTKVVLKHALRGIVPEEILSRPKKGFGIPVAAWIRGPLRPLFEDLFSEGSLQRSGAFEPAALRAMLQRHLSGQADLRKPLWTAAMFLLWQRRWGGQG